MLAFRARELKINAFYQNKKNKIPAYRELQAEYDLKPKNLPISAMIYSIWPS